LAGLPYVNGLILLESEKDLFPKDMVKPHWGVGAADRDEPEHILTYQLTANECPFYSEGGCRIHDKRPLVCRAFPVLLLSWERRELGWSGNCSWVRKHFGGREVKNVEANAEVRAAATLASILSTETGITCAPPIYWNYDLGTNKWFMLGTPSGPVPQQASSANTN
jgi:Fe-S-cluster containining protein